VRDVVRAAALMAHGAGSGVWPPASGARSGHPARSSTGRVTVTVETDSALPPQQHAALAACSDLADPQFPRKMLDDLLEYWRTR
jgi:hypothetical protein